MPRLLNKKRTKALAEGVQPFNIKTLKCYKGLGNLSALDEAQHKHEYKTRGWATYKQAQELKLRVRKGERATMIFSGYREKSTEEGNKKKVPMWAFVFNYDQLEVIKEAKA
jgi:antirestriction protein ArdC